MPKEGLSSLMIMEELEHQLPYRDIGRNEARILE